MQPKTRYARLGGDRIAYQVLGQGPPDLVLATGFFSHVDIGWEDPGVALYVRSLASFCRVIYFDRRGTGASDPVLPGPLPLWESHADEVAAIMDEVGSERAAILAEGDARPHGDLLRCDQTGSHHRAHPVAHHAQVHGRRRLSDRRSS